MKKRLSKEYQLDLVKRMGSSNQQISDSAYQEMRDVIWPVIWDSLVKSVDKHVAKINLSNLT